MSDDSRVSAQPNESRDITAQKRGFDTKRLGEVAELAFILKATSLGLTPSRPYGERKPYDFLLDCGGRVLRIQVKSVSTNRQRDKHRFSVNVTKNKERRRAAYELDDIDFVAAYVAPHNLWYVIPVDALAGRTFINLYPLGKRRTIGGLFEKYREAWHLFTMTCHSGPPVFGEQSLP